MVKGDKWVGLQVVSWYPIKCLVWAKPYYPNCHSGLGCNLGMKLEGESLGLGRDVSFFSLKHPHQNLLGFGLSNNDLLSTNHF